MNNDLFDFNYIYRKALRFTLKNRYGFIINKDLLALFNDNNSSLISICKHLDGYYEDDKKLKKKEFNEALSEYFTFFNRLFRGDIFFGND